MLMNIIAAGGMIELLTKEGALNRGRVRGERNEIIDAFQETSCNSNKVVIAPVLMTAFPPPDCRGRV